VTDILTTATKAVAAERPLRPSSTFAALIGRDLRVLRRNLGPFAGQVIFQPLLLVFTFTYVLPHIGAGFGSGFAGYATLLVPGLLAGTALTTGISTVTTPLVADLGGSHEIDDRILAPISITGVAVEKILMGAVNAWLAALLVLPICELVSATPIHLHIGSWPVFIAAFGLLGITSAALGLTIGTLVKPHQVGILYGVFVIPIQFLGCVYYPWSALSSIRWVQIITLTNPLTYLAEANRAGLTPQIHHMPALATLSVGAVLAVGLTALATRLLRHRLQS
jgi:ABC-2 type transport system permease protein